MISELESQLTVMVLGIWSAIVPFKQYIRERIGNRSGVIVKHGGGKAHSTKREQRTMTIRLCAFLTSRAFKATMESYHQFDCHANTSAATAVTQTATISAAHRLKNDDCHSQGQSRVNARLHIYEKHGICQRHESPY